MKRRRRLVLPDPERTQLYREVEEVNAKYPGTWKVLLFNRPEWYLITMGSIGCLVTGASMPIFAYFFAEMYAVSLNFRIGFKVNFYLKKRKLTNILSRPRSTDFVDFLKDWR